MKRIDQESDLIQVVLIEDEPVTAKLMRLELEKHNFKVHCFLSAKEGLSFIEHHHIDIVLTDIFIPDLDGVNLIKIIRLVNKEIPIIAMSSQPETKYISVSSNAIAAGANSFFPKPVNKKALLEKIVSLI
ncbi:MAG: response regulator [SAR324 cluster bacterium]|nr:response regulator [SAR324 cluster bacterium]